MQALVSGEIDLGTGGANALTQLNDGSVKPIAQIGTKRAWVRDVPTFPEAGFNDLVFRTPIWVGLLVPAKTPRATIDKLVSASKVALWIRRPSNFSSKLFSFQWGIVLRSLQRNGAKSSQL